MKEESVHPKPTDYNVKSIESLYQDKRHTIKYNSMKTFPKLIANPDNIDLTVGADINNKLD